jgi:hypothetical protein
MATPFCLQHLCRPVSDRVPIFEQHDDLILVTDPQGVIMFHHTDDLPEPTGRLRRRHLVAAIAERVGFDTDTADELLETIETVIERNAGRHERYAILPRAGAVDARPGGFPGYVVLTRLHTYEPLIRFSSEIANDTGLDVCDVELALAIIIKMVEGASETAAVYVPGWGYHGDEAALDRVRRESRRELVAHYRANPATTWVLQCNPKMWDIHGFIDENGELPSSWSIVRYRDQITEGDRVVLWLAGPDAGVYAIGEVVGAPERDRVASNRLAHNTAPEWEWFVPIELDLDLFDSPIPRAALKADPRFSNQPIIRVPGAANPHPLDRDSFDAILDRVEF